MSAVAAAPLIAGGAPPTRCARSAPARVPADSWSPTRRELAPPGAGAIRLCRYSGLNGHPRLRLRRSVLSTAPGIVRELVREFDELPSNPGPVACPGDDGSKIVAQLAYPNGRAVTISVGLQGCVMVTNGNVYRTAAGFGSPPAFGPQLVARLKRLTAPVPARGHRPRHRPSAEDAEDPGGGTGRGRYLPAARAHAMNSAWNGRRAISAGRPPGIIR
jgi:hypothetical protein